MAFPLHPETPAEGLSLQQLFAGRNVDIAGVRSRLKKAADDAGLPLTARDMTYNSRKATELGKWAEEVGSGDAFHDAVFRAYFAEGLNIGDIDVLKQICRKLDLDPGEAERVIAQKTFGRAVDEDWEHALKIGISAVPTFIMDGRAVVGAQPYDTLEKLVTQNML